MEIPQVILLVVVVAVICAVGCGIAAFFMGVSYRRKVAEAEMGSAEEEAKRIVSDALKTAESKKKESLVEAKDEIFKMRTDAERELKERRNEVQRQERRISQKEESLDRKLENLEQKDEKLQNKLKQADETLAESEQIKARQLEELERISGFTAETAKAYLLSNLEETLVHEKAIKSINSISNSERKRNKGPGVYLSCNSTLRCRSCVRGHSVSG